MKKYLDDILLFSGAICITVGVALIYIPAAWIVGGILAIAGGWVYAKAMQPVQTTERQITDAEVSERSR